MKNPFQRYVTLDSFEENYAIIENAQGVPGGTRRIFDPKDPVIAFQQKNSMWTQILGQA